MNSGADTHVSLWMNHNTFAYYIELHATLALPSLDQTGNHLLMGSHRPTTTQWLLPQNYISTQYSLGWTMPIFKLMDLHSDLDYAPLNFGDHADKSVYRQKEHHQPK